ncbi:MAG: Dabb family protein [Planctomycetota bacterium]
MPGFHHTVHFWLKPDLTDAERSDFLAAAKAIAESPNVATCRVGVPAGTDRPIVDNSYDVQLHCTFAAPADHDAYQSADDHVHNDFINTFKSFWTRVLIYDSVDA